MPFTIAVSHEVVVKLDPKIVEIAERVLEALEADKVLPRDQIRMDNLTIQGEALMGRIRAVDQSTP